MAEEKRIRVVAAVIQRDGKYLITQRRPEAVLPMLWEFPGGRVEGDEEDDEALRREMLERLGVEIGVDAQLSSSQHEYSGYTVTITLYKAHLETDDLRPLYVNAFCWITSEEFDNYAFPPADQATMDRLLGFHGGKC